jgi:hypothetical protein
VEVVPHVCVSSRCGGGGVWGRRGSGESARRTNLSEQHGVHVVHRACELLRHLHPGCMAEVSVPTHAWRPATGSPFVFLLWVSSGVFCDGHLMMSCLGFQGGYL